MKELVVNRKAYFIYEVLESFEAGIALTGTEVKSIKEGKASIVNSYAYPEKGELILVGAHIARYPPAGIYNHNPTRLRKLLLHRRQIDYIVGQLSQKGRSLVPLKFYLKDNRIKVELALVRGRKIFDRREQIKQREEERQIKRALKIYRLNTELSAKNHTKS